LSISHPRVALQIDQPEQSDDQESRGLEEEYDLYVA
jgi:hypothetical protein